LKLEPTAPKPAFCELVSPNTGTCEKTVSNLETFVNH